jgi:hypothetical protein
MASFHFKRTAVKIINLAKIDCLYDTNYVNSVTHGYVLYNLETCMLHSVLPLIYICVYITDLKLDWIMHLLCQ